MHLRQKERLATLLRSWQQPVHPTLGFQASLTAMNLRVVLVTARQSAPPRPYRPVRLQPTLAHLLFRVIVVR